MKNLLVLVNTNEAFERDIFKSEEFVDRKHLRELFEKEELYGRYDEDYDSNEGKLIEDTRYYNYLVKLLTKYFEERFEEYNTKENEVKAKNVCLRTIDVYGSYKVHLDLYYVAERLESIVKYS